MNDADSHRHRKRFGQHFLVDDWAIDRIVERVDARPGERVLEIGPGDAALTVPLLASGCELSVVEIDRDLAARLERRFAGEARFSLYCADVLKFDFSALVRRGQPWKVVGNLPYNISTPLLLRLLAQGTLFSSLVVMVQREVAERMAAPCGGGDYGRLSIAVQRLCSIERCVELGPDSFDPPPKVDSTVVELVPRADPMTPAAAVWLDELVRFAFAARRKTIANALRSHTDDATLRACGLSPGARAAELSVADYVRLAEATLPR